MNDIHPWAPILSSRILCDVESPASRSNVFPGARVGLRSMGFGLEKEGSSDTLGGDISKSEGARRM